MKRALVILASFLLSVSLLCAQEIVAGLSSHRAQVGEPIQLVVTIRGARGAEVPQTIAVNGLRINLAGRSTQFEMKNFKMSSTLTYTYIVVPQFEGEFTIPSFDISMENKTYRTSALRLSVSGSASMPQLPVLPQNAPSLPSNIPPSATQNGRPFFAELLLSKKSAYVGEVVPIELRFYFNTQISGEIGERPNFSGEGFTVQKFSKATKREQTINEVNYVAFNFQSAITPVKSGTLSVPAASLEARLQMPGSAPQGLSDFFSAFPSGIFTEAQEVKIETAAQNLEVLPLPKIDRPEDFSGAVGKFMIEVSVSPKKAAGGEPVTLRVKVAGQGNFEGMGAPELTNDEGWRSYPPSDQFHSTDAINFTGEKSFEFQIIARHDQTHTPGVRFSYFDPATGKYMTLTQDPLPVDAKVGKLPQQSPNKVATPPPVTIPSLDITAMSGGSSSWTPLFFHQIFRIANALLALIWLAVVIAFSLQKFSASNAGQRRIRKKQARRALAQLHHTHPTLFYDEVIRFLALYLHTPSDPSSLSKKIISSSFPDPIKSFLHELIERHSESQFAGGRAAPPSAEQCQQILATLKELRHEK